MAEPVLRGPLGGITNEIDIELQLRGPLAARLASAAFERRVKPAELLADIIETVLTDDLIAAVVDG